MCNRYEAFFNGIKRADYLTMDASALKLSPSEGESLSATLKKCFDLYDNFDFLFPDPTAGERKPYSGIPVKWSFASKGKTTFALEFTSITSRAIDPKLFELPAGLKKEDIYALLLNQ